MEQYVIIYGIVATGCISSLVQYFTYQSKQELEKDMLKIDTICSTACKSLSAACVIFAFIAVVFGLTGDLAKTEVINYVVSFFMYALIFLVFNYSFMPPNKLSLFCKL
jgi:hypothetical protein